MNAEFPAPVVYANHEMSHRVADMVMGALASFLPRQVMACSQGTSAILSLANSQILAKRIALPEKRAVTQFRRLLAACRPRHF